MPSPSPTRPDAPEARPWHLPGMPLPAWDHAAAYAVDAWQRAVLYADVMRQRGNQYQAHLEEAVPNVLDFRARIIMSGLDLPRPVNYGLARILPTDGQATDPAKRPFVIVDPRAGHGPGIGGFKAESEIGVALRAGHPCYFVGFLPDPVPGQTVEDVMHAEAAFLEKVIALHPDSEGKPTVIGNCQAGWQILMTAAMRPELFGPIIVAGAPVSYWAGWNGRNPMRYSGGLLGGSWLTALTSDLGHGRFDGAWLVQNFENLNPANTLWSKRYNLYAKVDTEAPRYLDFEKYWGGYVFLNDVEIQSIVDNLFIGNRLSTAQLVTSDGVRLDLRNIQSPIVVFCSNGDNITPPPQALGWITDLYRDDTDIVCHDQTIVYAVHESIGHLGIFVSGSVGRKEHQKFTSNIDLIDILPAGLYQAQIADKTGDMPHAELASGDYVLSLQPRRLDDVRAIVQPDPDSDRRFAAVARISDINLGLYRQFLQPAVRAAVTPETARWLQAFHPLRVSYEWWSDRHPLAAAVARQADTVRAQRQPVDGDNPWLQWQQACSQAIASTLDAWRDTRDGAYEQTFRWIYDSPWVRALAATDSAGDVRPHPGVSPEHRDFVARQLEALRGDMDEGGLTEASVRALLFILQHQGVADERQFHLAIQLHPVTRRTLSEFKRLLRHQALLMRVDGQAAIAALPTLLARADAAAIGRAADIITLLATTLGPLPEEAADKLAALQAVFERAAGAAVPPDASPRQAALAIDPPATAVPAKTTARKKASSRPATRTPPSSAAARSTLPKDAPSSPASADAPPDKAPRPKAPATRRASGASAPPAKPTKPTKPAAPSPASGKAASGTRATTRPPAAARKRASR